MSLLCFGVLRNPQLRNSYSYFALTVMLFYGYSFANSLGISIIHSLEISRYLTNQLIYALVPQCMTIFFAAELLARKSQRKREATVL